jgi:hypothetical protein
MELMPFQSYLLRIILFLVVLFGGNFGGGTLVSAQTATDFSLWKDAKNAEFIHDWWSRVILPRDFRNVTGAPREELLAKTLSALAEIVADPHVVPSTRYNAILAAGQLEESPGSPPVPYPAALTYLVNLYQQEDIPHYLKYGALLGIVRHALCGIDPARRGTVIDLLLKTVMTPFEESEFAWATGHDLPLEPAAWEWFRHTALDGLSALKTAGIDGNVVTELLTLINHQSQKLEELCNHQNTLTREHWEQSRRIIELASKAAKTLGDLDYRSATTLDAKSMADAFIRFTQSICEVKYQMATETIEREGIALVDPAILLEQIVVRIKIGTQSVFWGMRSRLLTGSPNEHSFHASLRHDDPSAKRLDSLMTAIVELTTFLDEGERSRRSAAWANAPQSFKFDLSELRDALKKCSETLAAIQEENVPVPSLTTQESPESHSKPLLGSLGKIGNSVIAANTAVLQFAYFPKTGFERLCTYHRAF